MQTLLVQLLQQLVGLTTTEDEWMKRLLLAGCCMCLQSVCLQSPAANLHVSVLSVLPVATVVALKEGLSTCKNLYYTLIIPFQLH